MGIVIIGYFPLAVCFCILAVLSRLLNVVWIAAFLGCFFFFFLSC